MQPQTPQTSETSSDRQFSKKAVLVRRELAHQTIQDMKRLMLGWDNNSMTATQPLTVTLNAAQIEAVTREFNRLRDFELRTRDVMFDWELDGVVRQELQARPASAP